MASVLPIGVHSEVPGRVFILLEVENEKVTLTKLLGDLFMDPMIRSRTMEAMCPIIRSQTMVVINRL